MSRLEDDDGIDGPFERAIKRAEREDAKKKRIVGPIVSTWPATRRGYGWRVRHAGKIVADGWADGKRSEAVAAANERIALWAKTGSWSMEIESVTS